MSYTQKNVPAAEGTFGQSCDASPMTTDWEVTLRRWLLVKGEAWVGGEGRYSCRCVRSQKVLFLKKRETARDRVRYTLPTYGIQKIWSARKICSDKQSLYDWCTTWKTLRDTNVTRTDKVGSQQWTTVSSSLGLLCVGKICNATAHKLPGPRHINCNWSDPVTTISSSVLWTHLHQRVFRYAAFFEAWCWPCV